MMTPAHASLAAAALLLSAPPLHPRSRPAVALGGGMPLLRSARAPLAGSRGAAFLQIVVPSEAAAGVAANASHNVSAKANVSLAVNASVTNSSKPAVIQQVEKVKASIAELKQDTGDQAVTLPFLGLVLMWVWPWLLPAPLRLLCGLSLLDVANPIFAQLQFLRMVCSRLLVAAVCGAIIGLERKDADRPAGLRSLCLVSTGSALYVMACMFSPEIVGKGDAARAAAQVCTGVGFIGAGVIAKGNVKDPVRGVTTACAVWVTAAVGVVAAAGLPILAFYSCGLTVTILRVTRWYNLLMRTRMARSVSQTLSIFNDDMGRDGAPPMLDLES